MTRALLFLALCLLAACAMSAGTPCVSQSPYIVQWGNYIVIPADVPDGRDICIETPQSLFYGHKRCVTVGEFRGWLDGKRFAETR